MVFKIIGGILILALVLITLFFAIFVDSKLIFWYLTDKKSFKNKVTKKYTKDGKEVLFLGTLHDMHFTFDEYRFNHLKAVLLNYKPDVLLVESRQTEMDLGNYADGPIEMFYLSMIARNLSIPVIGIDWFDHKNHKPGTTNKLRDEHIFNNIVDCILEYKKPLVIIGATHLLVGDKLLKNKGFDNVKLEMDFSKRLFKLVDEDLVFDKDTVMYLQKRIKREKYFLDNNDLDDKWSSSINMQIQNLERFIKKVETGEVKIDS